MEKVRIGKKHLTKLYKTWTTNRKHGSGRKIAVRNERNNRFKARVLAKRGHFDHRRDVTLVVIPTVSTRRI